MNNHPEWGMPFDWPLDGFRAMGRADAELVAAAGRGDDAGAGAALRLGADPDATSMIMGEPVSALGAAARSGCPDTLACVLGAGANPDGVGGEGRPPIVAVMERLDGWADRGGLLELLLESGAEVDAADVDGRTALFVAAVDEDARCARLLASRGADPELPGPGGVTPAEMARPGGAVEAAIREGVAERAAFLEAGRLAVEAKPGAEAGRRKI